MDQTFLVDITVREIAGFQIAGFQYGSSFVTQSGAEVMVQQSEKPNPIFKAALEAFSLFAEGDYPKPMSVEQIMGRFKIAFDTAHIPEVPEKIQPVYESDPDAKDSVLHEKRGSAATGIGLKGHVLG